MGEREKASGCAFSRACARTALSPAALGTGSAVSALAKLVSDAMGGVIGYDEYEKMDFAPEPSCAFCASPLGIRIPCPNIGKHVLPSVGVTGAGVDGAARLARDPSGAAAYGRRARAGASLQGARRSMRPPSDARHWQVLARTCSRAFR
eukprot:6190342-Pleurochrysis_carterae.AAC.2